MAKKLHNIETTSPPLLRAKGEPPRRRDVASTVKTYAAGLGLDACGIARVSEADPEDRLGQWLRRGFHADMYWMARTMAIRQDVRLRLPGAQSVIVVARNYYAPRPEQPPGNGKVARYAWGRDYHRVLRKPLGRLAAYLKELAPESESFISIDSGPVLERTWAARAGVGWIGKNSLVLRRDLGSWFFLGVLVTTLELEPDSPLPDACGSCTACLDACPTGAIVEAQVVDATRCISYQTIENRREIPPAVARKMEDWVFGCDICQEVCPWNRFAAPTTEPDIHPRVGHAAPDLQELLKMTEDEFNAKFAGTPLRRAKWHGMRRNAAVALENRAAKT
ncbi:MAG: tRNA epoxyqueuosine(34) reductase QueG [Candidatus Hydrogenedentes bacterium]|nr:tRNA epoxyqueuosine(34) reductase QueG [Candidatus Hydrogenedentota bacterium]